MTKSSKFYLQNDYLFILQFNSLLPNEQSIELVLSLLANESILIQRKAFELLNEKLIKLDNQLLDVSLFQNV